MAKKKPRAFHDSGVPYSIRVQMWTASGGRCSFPECHQEILVGPSASPGHIGELAHIHSASPKGPRYDPTYPVEKLHSFENLVSMCPNHHAIVDTLVDDWPADELRRIKNSREAAVLEHGGLERWAPYLVTAHYVNVPRLAMLANFHGVNFAFSDQDFVTLRSSPLTWSRMFGNLLQVIRRLHPITIPAKSVDDLSELPPGSLISFDQGVRTRNVPYSEEPYWTLTPPLKNGPTVYFDRGNTRVVMPIDMKWITTNTAHGEFATAGMQRMAGIALLKRLDGIEGRRQQRRYVASPLIIGLAVSPDLASFYGKIGPDNT